MNRISLSYNLASMGASWKDKCFLFIYVIFTKWNGFAHARTFNLSYNGKIFPITFSGAYCDFLIFKEIFISEEYKPFEDISPRIIFDLGANIGLTAVFFACRYPNADIVAVEANPNIFAVLQSNTAIFPRIKCVCAMIGNSVGKNVFYESSEQHISSSMYRRNATDRELFVESVTLESLMKTYSVTYIDMLKFDIEGAEERIFNKAILASVGYLIGELHFDLFQEKSHLLEDIEARFTLLYKNASKKNRLTIQARKTYA